jgi:fatty acid synthase subunit alpha
VEIGPSTTLVNMAKRTIDLKYESRDTAQNVSRRLLAFQCDLDKICYEEKPVLFPVEEPPSLQAPVVKQSAPIPIAPKSPMATAAQKAVAEVEDSPVSAVEIATTIIATSMKKHLDELRISNSIKTLSGGRSTL